MEYHLVVKTSKKYLNVKQKTGKQNSGCPTAILSNLCMWKVTCKSENSFTESR